jgi:hypothetical protein
LFTGATLSTGGLFFLAARWMKSEWLERFKAVMMSVSCMKRRPMLCRIDLLPNLGKCADHVFDLIFIYDMQEWNSFENLLCKAAWSL